MLSRRELIAASVAGGLYPTAQAAGGKDLGGAPNAPAMSEQQRGNRDDQSAVADSVDGVNESLQRAFLSNSLSYGVLGKIRPLMELYFRLNTRFPDFIDIGVSVFFDLYDWHVKHGQPLMITRGPDGRYWMQFMFTTMVVRSEVDANYIGPPYDKA
jgi:hypothetical protein